MKGVEARGEVLHGFHDGLAVRYGYIVDGVGDVINAVGDKLVSLSAFIDEDDTGVFRSRLDVDNTLLAAVKAYAGEFDVRFQGVLLSHKNTPGWTKIWY